MLQIRHIDYVEFYVGNASQAAHFYRMAFGFTPIAFSSLETGERDRTSFVLQQNNITLIFTSALSADSPVAEHVRIHGDSVKDIAFNVDDVSYTFAETLRRGARPVMEPTLFDQEEGRFVKATVAAYGDTVHSFIHREGTDKRFFPGYQPVRNPPPVIPTGLTAFDHIAACVEANSLKDWFDFYIDVFDFHHSHQEDIVTENTAMNSGVVESSNGLVKFPLMEPAPSKRSSQIEEYLEFHHGPGAQHIALLSDDIVQTMRALRSNGIDFLYTPDTYYEKLEERVGTLDALDIDKKSLRELGILVDQDKCGTMFQVFSKPLHGRPTTFMEIIQRNGARGFGGGNIKALFEAIEREQVLRGNL
jgi:4-hydroxyphenylpyruvate dioxygenase